MLCHSSLLNVIIAVFTSIMRNATTANPVVQITCRPCNTWNEGLTTHHNSTASRTRDFTGFGITCQPTETD